jgi:hypothetical protein
MSPKFNIHDNVYVVGDSISEIEEGIIDTIIITSKGVSYNIPGVHYLSTSFSPYIPEEHILTNIADAQKERQRLYSKHELEVQTKIDELVKHKK